MRTRKLLTTTLATVAVVFTVASAGATETLVDLANWDIGELYDGWNANRLIDAGVRDKEGQKIGKVHDILVDAEGRIAALIIEAGGFLQIGVVHVRVDWDDVRVAQGLQAVDVPISENNVDAFSLFGGEKVYQGPREWRLSALIGDYVTLTDVGHFGWVRDVVFENDTLKAVLVQPDVRHRSTYGISPYAYPYYGFGPFSWDPGLDFYALPYAAEDVKNLPPFDYHKFRS